MLSVRGCCCKPPPPVPSRCIPWKPWRRGVDTPSLPFEPVARLSSVTQGVRTLAPPHRSSHLGSRLHLAVMDRGTALQAGRTLCPAVRACVNLGGRPSSLNLTRPTALSSGLHRTLRRPTRAPCARPVRPTPAASREEPSKEVGASDHQQSCGLMHAACCRVLWVPGTPCRSPNGSGILPHDF